MSEQKILDELRIIRALVGNPDTDPGAWSPSPPRTRVTSGGAGHVLGEQILQALNINAKNVTKITLEIYPEMPTLTVEFAIFKASDLSALQRVMERYRVTPIGSTPVADSPDSTE